MRPEQFSGEVTLEGAAGLSVCGVGVQVGAKADLMTDGPLPFNVEAEVDVSADMPWPLDPVEATVHFEWSLPAPPQIEPPLAGHVGKPVLKPRPGTERDRFGEQGHGPLFQRPARRTKPRAEKSPVVSMDSHVMLEFTHEINSAHFARHPDGEEKIFDVGYFRFTPTLTSVRLYECKKNADGTVSAGKPLAGRILDDYPSLMRPLPSEPKRTCIAFDKWSGQDKAARRGAQGPRREHPGGAGNMVFQTIENQCHASQMERLASLLAARRKLLAKHPELANDNSLAVWRSWAAKQKPESRAILEKAYPELSKLWEALFPKKRSCVCLGLTEDLAIHFPEPVSEVVIHLCRSAKIPESNERPQRVTAKAGVETVEDFEKQLSQTDDADVIEDWKNFLGEVESIRRAPPDEKEKLESGTN